MPSTFYLEIVTADRIFFSGQAEMVVIPAIGGSMGVMAGHEAMVAAISIGELKIVANGETKTAAISGGFIEIMPDHAIILADSCEWPEEIDANRAKAAIERAEERLRQERSKQEYLINQTAIARALARLRVTKDFKN